MDNHSQLFAYKTSKLDNTLNDSTYSTKWYDEPIDLAVINNVETGRFSIAVLFCNRIRSLNVSDFGVLARGRRLKIPKRIQYALAFWGNSFYVANKNSNAINISLFNSSDGQL